MTRQNSERLRGRLKDRCTSKLAMIFTLRASLFSPSFRAQAIMPAYDTSSGKRHNSSAVPISADVMI